MSQPGAIFSNPVARVAPSAAAPKRAYAAPSERATTFDVELVQILDAPRSPGETIAEGYVHKEAALRDAIARLSLADARQLARRLSIGATGDAIVERFARLTADRRARLTAYVADAPRRAAIAAAKAAR